jgi:porphobilinogen synthase
MPSDFKATAPGDSRSESRTATLAAEARPHLTRPSYWEPVGVDPLRATPAVRALLGRPLLQPHNLIMGVLVVERHEPKAPAGLPVFTVAELEREASGLTDLGISAVKVFAASPEKDRRARGALNRRTLMVRALEAIGHAAPDLCVITETCLCPYTENGHCVLVNGDGTVDLEGTCALLAETALLQVEAGAHVVGPAGMIEDGVRAVREALDEAGHRSVPVMPHLIFDSCLYLPYRSAMRSAPAHGHRRAFHIDPARPVQAVDQARAFLRAGASMLLVEPAMPILDILVTLRSALSCPLAAFSVSGEFRLLRDGSTSERLEPVLEFTGALVRSGMDFVVTYAARELARACTSGNGGRARR